MSTAIQEKESSVGVMELHVPSYSPYIPAQAKLREMRHEKRAQAQAAYDQYRMETFREAEHHAVAFNDAQLALEPLKEGEG